MTKIPHIIIVGGGAGGLELTTTLAHSLGKKHQANITLVDCALTHLWKPLLHELAAGTLNNYADEVNYVTHAYNNGYDFQLGSLQCVDREAKTITISDTLNHDYCELVLPYDFLVLAIGSQSNNFNIPGANKHCYYLDSITQAKRIHQYFLKEIIHSQFQQQKKPFNIIIVGGGATGVELAGELHNALHQIKNLKLSEDSPKSITRMTLVEAADRLLAMLPERISKFTVSKLESMQVRVMTGERVTEIHPHGLNTESAKFIRADVIIWAAGVKGRDVATQLADFELNRAQQIKVLPTLQTTVDPHIFAIGDCAACPTKDGKQVPARAQAAHQQATTLAKTIKNLLKNRKPLVYQYQDRGSLISLSKHSSIGQLMGKMHKNLMIEGRIARLVYLSLYRMHQAKIFGWWRVFTMSLANLLTRRVRSRLKLH